MNNSHSSHQPAEYTGAEDEMLKHEIADAVGKFLAGIEEEDSEDDGDADMQQQQQPTAAAGSDAVEPPAPTAPPAAKFKFRRDAAEFVPQNGSGVSGQAHAYEQDFEGIAPRNTGASTQHREAVQRGHQFSELMRSWKLPPRVDHVVLNSIHSLLKIILERMYDEGICPTVTHVQRQLQTAMEIYHFTESSKKLVIPNILQIAAYGQSCFYFWIPIEDFKACILLHDRPLEDAILPNYSHFRYILSEQELRFRENVADVLFSARPTEPKHLNTVNEWHFDIPTASLGAIDNPVAPTTGCEAEEVCPQCLCNRHSCVCAAANFPPMNFSEEDSQLEAPYIDDCTPKCSSSAPLQQPLPIGLQQEDSQLEAPYIDDCTPKCSSSAPLQQPLPIGLQAAGDSPASENHCRTPEARDHMSPWCSFVPSFNNAALPKALRLAWQCDSRQPACITQDLTGSDAEDALQAEEIISLLCELSISASTELRTAVKKLNRYLRLHGLDANSIPALFWVLGKLEAKEHSQRVIRHTAQMLRTQSHVVSTFDPRGLSNCLYGMSKMSCKEAKKEQNLLAACFITELTDHVDTWITDSQSLSNSLYGMAILGMHGVAVQSFLQVCTTKLADDDGSIFFRFTSQGLSNTIWALEKLAIQKATWMSRELMRRLLVNTQLKIHSQLDNFSPQELSCFALATAKLMELLLPQRSPSDSVKVLQEFIVDMAEAAGRQREELTPQGYSNIGLALEKAGALQDPRALFLISGAAEISTSRLAEWTPQAISNFAYVLGKLPFLQRKSRAQIPSDGALKLLELAKAWMNSAALECSRRLPLFRREDKYNFSWQDLSGVINTLGKIPEFGTPETKEMVREVVTTYAPGYGFQMSTQSMLNIGVAALTIGISTQQMEPMTRDIAAEIDRRKPNITPKDVEQWARICKWR